MTKKNFTLLNITFPLLMILLTSYTLSAQTKMGFNAGISFANVSGKFVTSTRIPASPGKRNGFTAGILVHATLSTNFGFQTALNFVQKGYTMGQEEGTDNLHFNYLEVPVNLVFNSKLNEGFFIGAGPSIAYGISGKDKFISRGGTTETIKIKFGPGAGEIKPFDFGANALAGYKFKGGLMISGNYNLGLNKINNDDDGSGDGTIKNRYFALKIGYIFSSIKRIGKK